MFIILKGSLRISLLTKINKKIQINAAPDNSKVNSQMIFVNFVENRLF